MLKKLRLPLLALLIVAFSAFLASRLKSYAPPALAVVGQLNVGAQTDLINYVKSKTIYQSDLYFGPDQNAGMLTSTGYIIIGQPVPAGTAVAPAGFLLDANGRMRGTGVNIGTTATTYKLEVLDPAVSHGNAARFQGNVGIGFGVTANDVPLNIYQTNAGAPGVKINDSNNKPVGFGVNNGNMIFTTNNGVADSTSLTIKNDGNLGVGTTNPSYRMQVHSSGAQTDLAVTTNTNLGSANTAMLDFISDADGTPTTASIGQFNTGDLRFSATGNLVTPHMTILNSNGNVGIAQTVPAAKLDIGGTVSMISNNAGNINIIPTGNTIFSQGNVGVGTGTPGNRIEVMRTLVNDSGSFIGNINSKLYGTTTGTSNTALRGDNQLGQTGGGGINSGVWGTSLPNGQTVSSVNIGVIGSGGAIGYGLPAATLAGTGVGVLAAGSSFDIYAPSGSPSYFAGKVGIGTTVPDASLDLGGGAISSSANGQTTYQNVYEYADSNSTDTGTLAIVMPQGWTNTMMRIRIIGYDYGATGSWEVVVGGYNYQPSTSWYNYTAEIRGMAPFNQVRLGYNGSKMVVLLGNTTTAWHYPKFTVTEFVAGHQNITGWGSGWSSSFLVSEASIANIVTPAINMYMATGGNLGIGGPTVVSHRLESNGTAVIGALAAKVLNMGSWLCPSGGMEMGSSGQGAYCFVNGLSIDGSGNVGVGTLSPVSSLDVRSSTVWRSFTAGGNGGTDVVVMGNTSNRATIGGHNSALNAWTDLAINPGGNVGVGTYTPKSKFSVSFGNSDMLNVYQPADNQLALQTTIDDNALNNGYAYADTNYIFRLQPYVGSVVVGQPGLFPYGKLEVSMVNPSGWSGNLKAFRVVSPDTNYYLSLDTAGCANGGVCWTYTTNVGQALTIGNAGNIGIGTTSPASRLEMYDTNPTYPNQGSIYVGSKGLSGTGTGNYTGVINTILSSDGTNAGTWYATGKLAWMDDRDTGLYANSIAAVGGTIFANRPAGYSSYTGMFDGNASLQSPFLMSNSPLKICNTGAGGSCFNGTYFTNLYISFAGGGSQYAMEAKPVTNGTTILAVMNAAGGYVGGVTQSATNTGFATSSDIRLKENISPTKLGIDTLMKISVRDFNFIAEPNKRLQGFIAQDLYSVYPYAVTKGGDDPKLHPWVVDYGRLTPLIVKSVQEQEEKIVKLSNDGDVINKTLKEQQNQLNELSQKNQDLEKRVAKQEEKIQDLEKTIEEIKNELQSLKK